MDAYLLVIKALNCVGIVAGAVLLLIGSTHVFTRLRFSLERRRFKDLRSTEPLAPPHLPHSIPWLGKALEFLNKTPHQFWRDLLAWYPRDEGACSMTMGGEHTTLIFNKTSIQHLMKDRKLGRGDVDGRIGRDVFNLSEDEVTKYYAHNIPAPSNELHNRQQEEKLNVEYLLKAEKVNELTTEFARTLQRDSVNLFKEGPEDVELFHWFKSLMFTASTTALWGTRVLEVVPELGDLFFEFDQDVLGFLFRLPKWIIPTAFSNREKAIKCLMHWHETVDKELDGAIPEPETTSWEPFYGSRVNRARHLFYRKLQILPRTKAGLDLGFLFGLSSNAIPAAEWTLAHVIDSRKNATGGKKCLYDYVLAEIIESQHTDGSLNVAKLVNQPILLSVVHEVMRLYIDTLVSRQIERDLTIPYGSVTDGKPSNRATRSLLVRQGSLLIIPTYVAHMDPSVWQSSDFPHHPSPEFFYPYRFLTAVPGGCSAPVFTTSHADGMLFPFGGGKTICPGRTFAKQEIIAGVAIMLLMFDFDLINYTDDKGARTESFPGLRDTFPGSVVMAAKGDMKVRVTVRPQDSSHTKC